VLVVHTPWRVESAVRSNRISRPGIPPCRGNLVVPKEIVILNVAGEFRKDVFTGQLPESTAPLPGLRPEHDLVLTYDLLLESGPTPASSSPAYSSSTTTADTMGSRRCRRLIQVRAVRLIACSSCRLSGRSKLEIVEASVDVRSPKSSMLSMSPCVT
jgi:hypothetical protein